MEQFHVTPVEPPKKRLGKRSIILIVIVAIFLLGSIVASVYFAFQTAATQSKVTQLEADKAKLNSDITKLKADRVADVVGNQAVEDAPKNANNLSQVLESIYQHTVDLTSDDESTIMEVAKQHYKVDMVPEGATVIVGYEMVKPDTKPSGQVRALVYWPGAEGERPEFFDVIKDAGKDTWRYDEYL